MGPGGNYVLWGGVTFAHALSRTVMPTVVLSPKRKVVAAKAGAAKAAAEKPLKKSSIIPNLWKGKVTLAPDFFEAHERPANWPSGE